MSSPQSPTSEGPSAGPPQAGPDPHGGSLGVPDERGADIEAYVDATAALLELPLAAAHRPGVIGYFKLASGLAALVNGLPLTPMDDPAVAFVPLGPDDLPDDRPDAADVASDGAAHG